MECLIALAAVFVQSPKESVAAQDAQGKEQFYMIGHAHIDPVWRWTKDEGYQEVFATFRAALDRMK